LQRAPAGLWRIRVARQVATAAPDFHSLTLFPLRDPDPFGTCEIENKKNKNQQRL
jgi:hypothetical protein